MRQLLVLSCALVAAGCTYTRGSNVYAGHPELQPVRLATGKRPPIPAALGMVYASVAGSGDCGEIASQALAGLLEEARAAGATRVEQAQFRARYHWTGRPVCRRAFWKKSVDVRGVAVP